MYVITCCVFFRCIEWIESCGHSNLPTINLDILSQKFMICSLHFEIKMFSNFKRNRLNLCAIPTVFEDTGVPQSSDFV